MSIENNIVSIIEHFGEDLERPGLVKTPERATKALEFLNSGYNMDLDDIVNEALFPSDNRAMVIVKDIEFFSTCEHHMLPFYGNVHVGYIPNGQVIGLSKIPRIIDMFSRRLQIQENMSKQIADTIAEITGASGVGVVVEGKHMCMMMRGVQKQNSFMISSSLVGSFMECKDTRSEFMDHLNRTQS
ncbi:GTP cyclohydrolase 1 [BD1-7 clade bacterium]|uniref:GTP cyclohydrolase 1 n=1 Tax=BD1-7 clade bacterium TaxID=2029982 RepID=A0A5S9QSB4_9GAMM|nr:GTP cyclohydrolase 1 [BD1-7 clade bacterium]CAA0122785.1 GTP cyclohydrolase 1 [BD1-7 clade bacterium]